MPLPTDAAPNEAPVSPAEQLLDKLSDFEPTTFPVLSLYLNMQPDQHGRTPDLKPYLERELKALAQTWQTGTPERESFDRDAERIVTFVDERVDNSVNGLALFACSAKDFFETMQMDAPIPEHRIYVYNQPHLYQLALIDDENPRYAAVLTDANRARIFIFGFGRKLDDEQVKGKKMHRVKVGGWSQARYQRRVENAQQQHAKEVAEHLARIVREDKVTQIVVTGDSETVPVLMEELPQELRDMVVEGPKIARDASEQEVFEATMEKIKEESVKTDAEKVERLLETYRARGLAAVGPEATLEALTNGQVDELLLSKLLEKTNEEPVAIDAVVAPEIPDSTGGTESDEPREVSLPDLLVTKAKQTSADITFIQDSPALESVGGVAAFLRWRT
jgi:peptide subunit release factor 1 (eRF1)